jgi:hypothetical protein
MPLVAVKKLIKVVGLFPRVPGSPILALTIAFAAAVVPPVMGQPKRESNEFMRLWSDNSADVSLPRILVIDNGVIEQYYDNLKTDLNGQSYSIMRYRTSKCVGDSALLTEMEYILNDNQYAVIQFSNGQSGMAYTEQEYAAGIPGYVSFMVNNSHGAKLIWASCTYPGAAQDARVKARNQIAKQNVMQNSSIMINDLYDSTASHSGYFNGTGGLTSSGIPAVASICASAIKKALTLYNANKPPKYARYGGAPVFREGSEWGECGVTNDTSSLPRVLMIGNSITSGYHSHVNANLAGKAVCSYLISSKSFGDPATLKEYEIALSQANFAVVHFNNGLHGLGSYSLAQFDTGFARTVALIKKIVPKAQLIWASATPAYSSASSESIVQTRNIAAASLCRQYGIAVDDLHTLANNHPETRAGDGFHYQDAGYVILAKQVSDSITQAMARYKASTGTKPVQDGISVVGKGFSNAQSVRCVYDLRGRKTILDPRRKLPLHGVYIYRAKTGMYDRFAVMQ